MKIMMNAGGAMGKKPWVSIGIVLLITLVALGSIVVNGVDFAMNEEDFVPDNPVIEANEIVGDAFSVTQSAISVVRADNVFTKAAFLSALEFEQAIMSDANVTEFLIDPTNNTNSITSPVKILSSAMMGVPPYTVTLQELIVFIDSMNDAQIQSLSAMILAAPEMQSMHGLFTKDLSIVDFAQAEGALMIINLNQAKIVDDGMSLLEFETLVDGIARNISATDLALENDVRVQLLGENLLMNDMGALAQEDLGMLFPIALVAIFAILIFMYRDLLDTLVSVSCLILAVIWTFGFGILTGVGINTVSMAVPILVLGLGIDYGLHLVFRYRERRMDGGDAEESAGYTLSTVGEALLLATFTTVVAFLSYLTSSMQMLADFGVLSALGIMSSFVIMLMVVPATQVIRDRRAEAKGIVLHDTFRYRDRKSGSKDYVGDVAGIGGRLAASKPLVALAITGIVLVGFGYGALNISYEFDLFDFLPEDTEGADLLLFIFEEFDSKGMSTASVLMYGDATDPELIRAMEASITMMVDTPEVINVSGVVNARYIGSVLLGANSTTNDSTYQELYPQFFDDSTGAIRDNTTQTNVQYLLYLLTMEEKPEILTALASVIGTHEGENVTQILVPVSDSMDNDEILSLRANLMSDIQPITDLGVEATVTGANIAGAVVIEEMSDNQMQSLLITLLFTVISLALVMFYLYRTPLLGVMAVIPTLVSVVAVWGTMFLLDISLNVMTLTIAALTVGMGVTYGIHIVHRFDAELRDGSSVEDAIVRTTRQTGKGVLGAALTTSIGFGIIGFSAMVPMQQFGIITVIAILYSYLGATLILPSMLVLWGRRKVSKA